MIFDYLYFTFAVWLHTILKKWSRERGAGVIFEINFTTTEIQSIGSSPALTWIKFVPEFQNDTTSITISQYGVSHLELLLAYI